MFKILDLEKKAEDEIYALIDKHLKPLPKNSDGTINKDAKGFQHNDVDALRHAYVSGVFTIDYSETVANILGELRELFPRNSPTGNLRQQSNTRNMDLWNNSVGRKYGKKSKTREELFNHLLKALENGELIIDLNDLRKHPPKADFSSNKKQGRVIVLEENDTGENTLFLDTQTLLAFSREEFVAKIKNGEYGKEYEIRIIEGREVPASKRDGHSNLG